MNYNKSLLIVVPHPDDELNIAGPLIPTLKKNGYIITVIFTTNGDYNINEDRIKECLNATKIIGVDSVHFLGYPDHHPNGGSSTIGKIIKPTHFNKTTPPSNTLYEYCYIKNKKHNDLTILNFYNDLKNCVLECKPNILIGIDEDEHPDHIFTSNILDKVVDDINNNALLPAFLYLKAFAYLGTWKGDCDYFSKKPIETLPTLDGNIAPTTKYKWESRVKIAVPKQEISPLFWRSKTYQAYKEYHSQNGRLMFFRCSNSDKCFFVYHNNTSSFVPEEEKQIHSFKACFEYDKKSKNKRFVTLLIGKSIYLLRNVTTHFFLTLCVLIKKQ